MTRYELRQTTKPKRFRVYRWVAMSCFLLFCIGIMLGFSKYANSTIKIEAPQVDNGRKVIVHLPNGREVFTYEKLIVQENGRLFYKGERNTLDLTGGKLEFKEW